MKLGNKTLEEWLIKPPVNTKKKGGDDKNYYAKFIILKEELNNRLSETTRAAILDGIKQKTDELKTKFEQLDKKVEKEQIKELIFNFEKVVWLNDHGSKHIDTVIERATQLVDKENIILNVREVYILLNSILLHDIGNFYGRSDHESKILDAINDILPLIGYDGIEKKYIQNIAKVHGGYAINKNNTRDPNTIITIQKTVKSDGYEIRKQLLASILRFADELADDKYRADSTLLFERKLPKSSEVFHAYSFCLDTVHVKHSNHTIELHFKVPKEFLLEKVGKYDNEIYLIDEIYERVLKMQKERIYCEKFWKGEIMLDKIWVQIEFYHRKAQSQKDFHIHDNITFTLHDFQYPTIENNIFELCEKELTYHDSGEIINGENLAKRLKNE